MFLTLRQPSTQADADIEEEESVLTSRYCASTHECIGFTEEIWRLQVFRVVLVQDGPESREVHQGFDDVLTTDGKAVFPPKFFAYDSWLELLEEVSELLEELRPEDWERRPSPRDVAECVCCNEYIAENDLVGRVEQGELHRSKRLGEERFVAANSDWCSLICLPCLQIINTHITELWADWIDSQL